jgi:putative phosphoesterase
MTSIGLISDVHAAPLPLSQAIDIFRREGVDRILCAGDIAGYQNELKATIDLLIEHECHTIIGNHDLLYLDHHEDDPDDTCIDFLKSCTSSYQVEIEGKKLYMVHAQPPDHCHGGIKLLDKKAQLIPEKLEYWAGELQSFDYDVLVVGHTHQVYNEVIAGTLVINPGSTVFNHCCAILRLPEMTVDFYALSGKKIERTWNWGEHVIYGH